METYQLKYVVEISPLLSLSISQPKPRLIRELICNSLYISYYNAKVNIAETPSSHPCLFAVQGIGQRLFSSPSGSTIPMHSTLIVKNSHDKSTSTVCLVNQNAVFDTIECVVNSSKAA